MIWTLTIECLTGMYLRHEWVRKVEIASKASLLELHDVIQGAVSFSGDHLFEFFAGRNWKNRKVVFGDGYGPGDVFANYSSISLERIYPLPKSCKLYYHFDFGDNWYFEIRKSRKKPREPEEGVQYPRVVESVGPNPEQYPKMAEY